jgi:hypothetical protein
MTVQQVAFALGIALRRVALGGPGSGNFNHPGYKSHDVYVNGKFHSTHPTKTAAYEKAKELRAQGHFAAIFPTGFKVAGGEGSGNFGHAGIPGQVGGSVSSGGVVDKTVYHGGVVNHAALVTYHSEDKELADSYVKMSNDRFGSGGALHESKITIRNPAPEHVVNALAKVHGIDNESYTPASAFDAEIHGREAVNGLVTDLKARGHDGAILNDVAYGSQREGKAYITFGKTETPKAAPPIQWEMKKGKWRIKGLGGEGSGNFGHEGLPGHVGGSAPGGGKMKAPVTPKGAKWPVATKEQLNTAYDLVKGGKTFTEAAHETGLHHVQVYHAVNAIDKEKGLYVPKPKAPKEPKADVGAKATPTPSAPDASKTPSAEPTPSSPHPAGYAWQEKTSGPQAGKYAYFEGGKQVSQAFAKDDYKSAIPTINHGAGPKTPEAEKPTGAKPASWPITDAQPRMEAHEPDVLMNYSGWASKTTSGEQHSINQYSQSDYKDINNYLKGGTHDYKHLSPEAAKTHAERIESALKKAPNPPPPELVWRGLKGSTALMMDKTNVGDEVQLKGFQSTSINPETAHGWGYHLVEIKPAAGGYIKKWSEHPHEQEFLLPHGYTYRVVGKAKLQIGDAYYSKKHSVVTQLEMVKK